MAVRNFFGLTGYATSAGQRLNITGWELTLEIEKEETTHTGSAGFKVFTAGPRGGSGSIDLNVDASSNFSTNPPNLVEGATVTLQLFYEEGSPFWSFSAIIDRVRLKSQVKGITTFTVEFTTTGTITRPVGTF
jgi:hypothetical protein